MDAPITPPLSPLMRFLWSLVAAGGGLGAVWKFAGFTARHEALFEDLLGSRDRLPAGVRQAISWQRGVWEYLPWIGLALAGLVAWIWMSKSSRAVRWVSLGVVAIAVAQGLICSAITVSHVLVVTRELLQAMPPAP